ncbi:MAG: hypothetical protein J6Q92_05200 [Oscillospiraceae bacterium]|nr:hypothetical protein [Oscillospiraceae bacterium]
MYNTYEMQEHICKELEKKAQTGIKSTSDLDTVWKLIDAYKNLLKIDMLQEAGEYADEHGYSQNDGYSERRRRDSRGRYSREGGGNSYEGGSSYRRGSSREGGYSEAREEYMDAKYSYRSNRSPESKRNVDASLHDCMEKLRNELHEMMENADTREEREKIKEMLREIGNIS